MDKFIFSLLGQAPEFLIAGNEGIIRSDYLGENPMYISRSQTDQSTGKLYNLFIYRIFITPFSNCYYL